LLGGNSDMGNNCVYGSFNAV